MAPDLIELIDEYYEAKKPYTQSLHENHDTSSLQLPSPEANTSTDSSDNMAQPKQEEPQFSISPRLPKEEIPNALENLKKARIEYTQQGKQAAETASAGTKKGKAPAGKK